MATFSYINNGDTGLEARTNINSGFSSVISELGVKANIATQSFITLADAATITWNYASGYNAKVTLTGQNRLLSISGATAGDYGTLFITQDAVTASRINFGATDKFPSGTYSYGATSSVNIFTFVYDGSNYYWNSNTSFR